LIDAAMANDDEEVFVVTRWLSQHFCEDDEFEEEDGVLGLNPKQLFKKLANLGR
jgi:hypothetical protein